MKPSPSILIVVALFAFQWSTATPKDATIPAPMCGRFIAAWHALPLPMVHLQFAGAALTLARHRIFRPAMEETLRAPFIERLLLDEWDAAKPSSRFCFSFELEIRSAGHRTAPAVPPVIVRLIVGRSGNAELSILSHNFRLAFPCSSA